MLPLLLEDVPLHECESMYFQHDGLGVRFDYLASTFPNLTPLDFYLWGCLKEKVNAMEVQDCNDTIQYMEDARGLPA
jgi:hypothetical protein